MSSLDRKALHILLQSPVNEDMVKFLATTAHSVIKTVPQAESKYPTPPTTPDSDSSNSTYDGRPLPSVYKFIVRLVRYTNVYTQTLLVAAAYLRRLQRALPRDATGIPSTTHRIFLACLILSAKYHNDSSPLNKHWTKYTDGLFSLADVNLMERQLLQLLNWDLRVSEEELIQSLGILINPIRRELERRQRKKMEQMKFYSVAKNETFSSSNSSLESTKTLVGSQSELKKGRSSPRGLSQRLVATEEAYAVREPDYMSNASTLLDVTAVSKSTSSSSSKVHPYRSLGNLTTQVA